MSLATYFQQLRAEKQVETFTLVQDNVTIIRDSRSSTTISKRAKGRPSMERSIQIITDPVAPTLPRRQQSRDTLDQTAPKLPQRKQSQEALSHKRPLHKDCADSCTLPSIPMRQQSRDKLEKLEPIVEQKRYQNAIFGSPRAARRGMNKAPSIFLSICEETRGLLFAAAC